MNEDLANLDKEEVRMILDIKRAVAMDKIARPNKQEELAAFWSKHNKEIVAPKKGQFLKYWYAAASVAAILLIGLFVTFKLTEMKSIGPKGIQVYAANQNSRNLSIDIQGKTYVLNSRAVNRDLSSLGIEMKGSNLTFKVPVNSNKLKEEQRTITTPSGSIYTLTLTDGSIIHLNAASKLTFPTVFVNGTRVVELEGEAYFEVAHDAKHPFIVKTPYFETTVLGTKFNVRAYSRPQSNVTLISGKVRVSNGKDESIVLNPEEQACLTADGKIVKQRTDVYPYLEWQKGNFYFDNVPLVEITRELGRWYNVDVIFENRRVMNKSMHFVANRNEDIRRAIYNLNVLDMFTVKLEDNKLIVK